MSPSSARNRSRGWYAAALLAAGWLLPGVLIGDGADRFSESPQRVAAGEAMDVVGRTCMGHPANRLLVRAVRVTEVKAVPGSCTVGPAPEGVDADLQVRLRGYGPFGIPVRSFTATCGGTYIAC